MFKRLLIVVCLIIIVFACWKINRKVTRFDLPEGELKWSYMKPENAKMCLPAAFTEMNGGIRGSYRYDGKSYQRNKYYRKVSLKDDMFFISKNWLSDNGFQQLTLVCDSKLSEFYDSRRKVRRALCKDENGAFILQSNYPMTMSAFAKECAKYSTNAAYLDMGEYGYGYIKKGRFKRPLYVWGFFTKHKQTNWIYIE